MVYYAVIDTNLLVSALLSRNMEAATVLVLEHLFSGDVIPVYNDDILSEYAEVLQRKKFKFSESLVQTLLDTIKKFGYYVIPSPTGETLPDMKDLPFYEVSMDTQDKNSYLVTGNLKHFPKKPFIVSAREFINIIEHNS